MRRCPSCSKSYPDNTQFCPEDGAALGAVPAEAGDPRIGTTIDRYRLEANLGTGGMGVVYRAEHIHLRRPVALKLLHAHLAEDAEVVERFFREARAAGDLASEHIVKVSDFGTFEDGAFLVMEYLPGKSLDTVVRGKRMDQRRAVRISSQIASALEVAHQKGVVHRDLKPANVILVEQDGDPDFVKVLDFGIAKLVQGETKQLTKTGIVMGTPAYMAPEQASGEKVDARTDIYALGVMLYEMLGGAPPFTGENPTQVLVAHVTRPPEPLRGRYPDIPEGLEQVVLGCLSKQPDLRPASMAALREALAPWSGDVPAPAAAATKAGVGAAGLISPAAIPPPATPPGTPAPGTPAPATPAPVPSSTVDVGTAQTVAPSAPSMPVPATPPVSAMAPTMAAAATPMGLPQASPAAVIMAATGPATPAGVAAPPTVAAVATPAPGLPAAAPPSIPPTAPPAPAPVMPLQDSMPHTVVPQTTMATAAPAASGNLTRVLIVICVLLGVAAGAGATYWFLQRSGSAKTMVGSSGSEPESTAPSSAGGSSSENEREDEDDEDDVDRPAKKKVVSSDDDEKKVDVNKTDDSKGKAAVDEGSAVVPVARKPRRVSARPRVKKKKTPPAAPAPAPVKAEPPPAVDLPPPAAAPPPAVRQPPPVVRRAPPPRPRRVKQSKSIRDVKQQYQVGKITRFKFKQRVDHLKFLRKKELEAEKHRYRNKRRELTRRYRQRLISKPRVKMLERAAKVFHEMRWRQIKEKYR